MEDTIRGSLIMRINASRDLWAPFPMHVISTRWSDPRELRPRSEQVAKTDLSDRRF